LVADDFFFRDAARGGLTCLGRAGNLPMMGNEYYVPGSQRAARVGDLFANIARRYDLLNDLQSFGMHRRWKRRVVELGEVRPGVKALDVCCGTGDLAFALADSGADAIGLDFSAEMLAVATERRAKRADSLRGAVQFLQGDALKLPFATDAFEVVTVGYGLRNLADWRAGLAEMIRVLRPGGRLVVLEFGKPDFAVWRWLYFGYLRLCVPAMGLLFCGNPSAYSYILESLKHYPAQHGVATGMREMDLVGVRIVNFLGGAMTINFGRKPG
jgi:demethylmenaquinone methyltransferase/2-methoxy-6-polyprenyl-1,4-benzoquinol methylase